MSTLTSLCTTSPEVFIFILFAQTVIILWASINLHLASRAARRFHKYWKAGEERNQYLSARCRDFRERNTALGRKLQDLERVRK